ncbi:hypothetical protein AB0L06_36240 [Spirillospora sp. NPDC052269]
MPASALLYEVLADLERTVRRPLTHVGMPARPVAAGALPLLVGSAS